MTRLTAPLATLSVFIVLCFSSVYSGADQSIQETAGEFIAQGDFDGDGLNDVVVVDKVTGRIRPGYQLPNGLFRWIDWRDSGTTEITGFSVGKLNDAGKDGLAFASANANQITVVDISSPTTPMKPIDIPFMLLGPSAVVAVDVGGAGASPLEDLVVGSIYNSPDENMGTLFGNASGEFEEIDEAPLPGAPAKARRVQLKQGSEEWVAVLFVTDSGATFQVQSFAGEEPVVVASLTGLSAESDYVVGQFRGGPLSDLLFYTPGEPLLTHRPVLESSSGQLQLGPAVVYELEKPIVSVIPLGPSRMLVIQGEGEEAGYYAFDGKSAPVLKDTVRRPTDQVFSGALPIRSGFVAFSRHPKLAYSDRYHFYRVEDDQCSEGIYGRLATLADNDNLTIPVIYKHIVATHTERSEADMRAYTNTIPGTKITYAMVPIHGGEFMMGSPEGEAGRQADEGPQHKVKLSPFWIGQYEVTWNEFELFMYPDEEKKMRKINPTNEEADKVADAITHPSKPYSDMTFGMGRDGYPAIAMTQHAANKYCQWLSAKTGHFYRLPTEAEWEYACRAGTTTPYFFGDNPSKLGDYGWYEMNSDFKYQKVGKKKPNPWGLYDIYGNVVEWVLDQYDPDFYAKSAASAPVVNPWNKATKPYPHSVRGGSWDDMDTMCRSAARRGSDPVWKLQDPQLPKSVWYFTDAQFVGFRVVRPLEVPPPDKMQVYWNSGVERE